MQKKVNSLLFGFAVSLAAVVSAQDPIPGEPAAPQETAAASESRLDIEKADVAVSDAAKNLKLTASKPRISSGYNKVADDEQQKQIRSIYQQYGEFIAVLKARLILLEQERDKRIEAVLTPEQRSKIKSHSKTKKTESE